jgi:hypothetical protein
MVNKKGWIRIVEASVAIVIIFSVILSVVQIRRNVSEQDLSESITPFLEEIAKNSTMRAKIISDNNASNEAENAVRGFLSSNIKDPNIGYDVMICKSDELCGLEKYPLGISGNLYAGSRIISATLTDVGEGPKKLSIFLWRKG